VGPENVLGTDKCLKVGQSLANAGLFEAVADELGFALSLMEFGFQG